MSNVLGAVGYDSGQEQDYLLEDLPDGRCHYFGSHGDFVFDPNEFQIMAMDSEESQFGCGGRSHIIRYVGSETDGSKIQIPKGITDGTCMFMNTGITSMPKLPSSLQFADAMFMGTRITSVYQGAVSPVTKLSVLPLGLKSTSFMFANCRDLEIGPMNVPPLVKNANFMFTGCEKLTNTPKLNYGLLYGDSMFAGCHSLTYKPEKPRSMKSSDSMTYDCPRIDAYEDAKAVRQIAADRDAFERKINRPTFRQNMGKAFSYMLQMHMMRQMGFGIVMAPVMTHMMRKNGVFQKDFSHGAAQVFSSQKNGVSQMLGKKIGKMGASYQQKLTASRTEQLAQWDALYQDAGVLGTATDKTMSYLAGNDYRDGLFRKMAVLDSSERQVVEERFTARLDLRETYLRDRQQSGRLTDQDLHDVAQWYVEQISGCAAYYAEGKRLVDTGEKYSKDSDKLFARRGLEEISKIQMDELVESAERMQASYHLFSDKDLRLITKILSKCPSEQGKSSDFAQRNRFGQDVMADKTRAAFAKTGDDYQKHRERQQKRSDALKRGEQAMQKFGQVMSDAFDQAKDSFGLGE